MNYLLMEKMEDYTTDMDQMLYYLTTIKEVHLKKFITMLFYKDLFLNLFQLNDLVVPYYASDLKDAGRITHVLKMI